MWWPCCASFSTLSNTYAYMTPHDAPQKFLAVFNAMRYICFRGTLGGKATETPVVEERRDAEYGKRRESVHAQNP